MDPPLVRIENDADQGYTPSPDDGMIGEMVRFAHHDSEERCESLPISQIPVLGQRLFCEESAFHAGWLPVARTRTAEMLRE